MSQGIEANHSGRFLETVVENEFRLGGIEAFPYSQQKENGDLFATRMLLRNVPYESIYGCNSKSEFLFRDFYMGRDIRIECKWQQEGGSVDEKFPYLLMNARVTMPEYEIWFVVDGGGAREKAIEWLRKQCAQTADKKLLVMTVPEVRKAIRQLIGRNAA